MTTKKSKAADPFGEGVRTVGGEAGQGFDARERLFFPVSGGKVNTGFGVGIFIPQLFCCQFSVFCFQLSVGGWGWAFDFVRPVGPVRPV